MDVEPTLVDVVGERIGTGVRVVGPTDRGESRTSYHLAAEDGRALVLKVAPAHPGASTDLRRLRGIVARLRARGYPAPEIILADVVDDLAVTVQVRLLGVPLERVPGEGVDHDLLRAVLPSLLDAVELQRDAGDLDDPPWPGWLVDTIEHGGDGYCLHETMRARSDTAAILDRIVALARRHARGPVRQQDVVHFDLSPANVLHRDGNLSGVVDWNVPFAGAAQGDRGFDLATLLFYAYDDIDARRRLRDEVLAVSGTDWTNVYLAHLALRQVEWTRRHAPGSAADRRFLAIANMILDDAERLPAEPGA